MNSLFERLVAAHRLISREIRREGSCRLPDQIRLSRLKKERLAIKDRLARHIPQTENTLRFVKAILMRMRRARA
jgi:uncharacterized protein YdcH (DUF465 family)